MSDTLSIAPDVLAPWQHDASYNYDRELVAGGSGGNWLMEHLRQFWNDLFNATIESDTFTYILIAVGGLICLIIAWLILRKRGMLFIGSSGSNRPSLTPEEDTIYGVDFEAEIARALKQQDYRQAVRWVYLQTLAGLSEAGLIEWQPQKTPSQYIKEVNRKPFSLLSHHFIRVRYADFKATEALYNEMRELQRQTTVKGDATA